MDRHWDRLTRRELLLGAGAASLGLAAGCGRLPLPDRPSVPRAGEVPRIGFLLAVTPASSVELRDAFRQGLADRGYVEGRDLLVEWRFGEGFFDRVPALAAELVALQPAVIVLGATVDAQVLARATSTLPIVVAGSGGDLVYEGLAASLARPGGNVTGLSTPLELPGKCLQRAADDVRLRGQPEDRCGARDHLPQRDPAPGHRGPSVGSMSIQSDPTDTRPGAEFVTAGVYAA